MVACRGWWWFRLALSMGWRSVGVWLEWWLWKVGVGSFEEKICSVKGKGPRGGSQGFGPHKKLNQ